MPFPRGCLLLTTAVFRLLHVSEKKYSSDGDVKHWDWFWTGRLQSLRSSGESTESVLSLSLQPSRWAPGGHRSPQRNRQTPGSCARPMPHISRDQEKHRLLQRRKGSSFTAGNATGARTVLLQLPVRTHWCWVKPRDLPPAPCPRSLHPGCSH